MLPQQRGYAVQEEGSEYIAETVSVQPEKQIELHNLLEQVPMP
jgi:hypothetical protein